MEQKTRMLIIKIKDCKVPVKGGKLTALAGRYFIFQYCVSSWWLLLFFVIVSRAIFVLYCSLVVILMFVLLYLDLGLLFVLCLGAILNNSIYLASKTKGGYYIPTRSLQYERSLKHLEESVERPNVFRTWLESQLWCLGFGKGQLRI